ncbi:aminopeptidase, partial [bacterium]
MLAGLALMIAPPVAAQQNSNPFLPPRATVHYAPDRTCDLQHVSITLDVDYPTRTYTGRAVNTLSPLRSGLTEIMLNAGPILTISRVTVNGRAVIVRREDRKLFIPVLPTKRGETLRVAIDYKGANSKAVSFGGVGGFHWIEPAKDGPATRVGFWTQGETEFNSDWVPMWDYPNDFATYDETYTVPSDWTAVGNGKLVRESKSSDGKRKTFVWRQDLPHATYLLTAVGGPFDVKKDAWRGKPLWYVVPRGQGKYIDASFGHTPDMLSFFSDRLGYEYPWAKYAQNAMYDFGGGMENVSATTLGAGSLSEPRDTPRGRTSLTSHELAHQWFGDTVTCQDWGDIFNNE